MAENHCMLAPQMPESFTHYNVEYPVLVQPKLDGIRCLIIEGVAYSRNMKPIRNKRVQILCKKMPRWMHDYVLDGEWYAHGKNFNQIQSIIMDEDDDLTTDFHFECWDALTSSEWQKKVTNTPYVTRFTLVANLMQRLAREAEIAVANFFRRINVNHYIGHPFLLGQLYMDMLNRGFEGVMIKDPLGFYKWGRCTVKEGWLLKYKPTFTIDLPIHRVEEGTGKWKGCIGAIWVLFNGKEVSSGPGRGVTEAWQRQVFKQRNKLPGKTVELYHSGLTADGSLRFPKFKTVRLDK